MLDPDYLDDVAEEIVALYERFSQTVINDIARRLATVDFMSATATSAWQAQRLTESGKLYNWIIAELAKITPISRRTLRKILNDAGVEAMRFDDEIYRAAGLRPLPLNLSPAMTNVLSANLAKTSGAIENLTMTTAADGYRLFVETGDLIHLQISSGAFDYQSALKAGIKKASAGGLSTVGYPSGHRDHLDVALRRAVLTGVNQTSGQLQWARADEMNSDLVQVSAHGGARPSHAAWQGKIFSRSGGSKKYPDFIATTGYGTGPGLMGWNCRHSFFPFFEDLSAEHYKNADLDKWAKTVVKYKGESISFYDATQEQRRIERGIRHWKRQVNALKAAGIPATREIAKVKEYQALMRDFIAQTGIKRQRFREQVYG